MEDLPQIHLISIFKSSFITLFVLYPVRNWSRTSGPTVSTYALQFTGLLRSCTYLSSFTHQDNLTTLQTHNSSKAAAQYISLTVPCLIVIPNVSYSARPLFIVLIYIFVSNLNILFAVHLTLCLFFLFDLCLQFWICLLALFIIKELKCIFPFVYDSLCFCLNFVLSIKLLCVDFF